jgi:leader peptidase (prepilin peptidase)/N-methyltransferase
MLLSLPLLVWLILLFMMGTVVGSFLNVCIHRLPFEKSVAWPGSRCEQCLQPVPWYDNLPLLSYWLLRGRCRMCGARFSARYFFVELLTGLGFAGLFYLEVVQNVHALDALARRRVEIQHGVIPAEGWMIFAYHALLLSFLIVASAIDLEHMEIPPPVTFSGTLVGLAGGALFWPWLPAATVLQDQNLVGRVPLPALLEFRSGIYAWPVWHTLPSWLPFSSWRTGLITGLAGALAGVVVLRAIGYLFSKGRGRQGIGLGDADLMMMIGSFLGWQPVVVSFFVAVFPGLLFGIIQLVLRGNKPFPYGPSLAVGGLLTCLGWQRLVASFPVHLLFFDGPLLLLLAGAGAVFMFIASLMMRIIFGPARE